MSKQIISEIINGGDGGGSELKMSAYKTGTVKNIHENWARDEQEKRKKKNDAHKLCAAGFKDKCQCEAAQAWRSQNKNEIIIT